VADVPVVRFIPKEILVPIDFSHSSKVALDTAADLALHFHSELVLVNIVPCFSIFALSYSIPDTALEQKMRERAEQLLMKCCETLTASGATSRYCIRTGNNTAENIVDLVDSEHIDLLVISTHGISGWHPLVFGAVAEKVVKLVQCPLLLLRSAKPETNETHTTVRSMEWW
jgi:nucleotide-binding universal stress UspA family protein